MIQAVVAPVFHQYEAQPAGAQSRVGSPPHGRTQLPVISQFSTDPPVTILLQMLLQPLALVTVTQ
jgi:hypothetical protein